MRFGMALLLVGCSDYDLHLKEDPNPEMDTAEEGPLPATATPQATAPPEEPVNDDMMETEATDTSSE